MAQLKLKGKQGLLARNEILVKVADLRPAPHNPPARIDRRAIARLAESMDDIGQKVPILIGKDHQIIEGHRRWAAAKMLKWDWIRCMVETETDDPDLVYASLGETMAKLTGNNLLGVYLKNPHAVPKRVMTQMDNISKKIGKTLLTTLYTEGYTIAAYHSARALCLYVDRISEENITKVLRWAIRHRMIGTLQRAMRLREDPRVIWNAVQNNKALVFKIEQAD